MLARFTHAVRQFLVDDDAGSVSVETVIIMPILLWVYVATFVIFDGFRTHNQNVKAAYTIGDMLSRETNAIDNAYLEGLSDVFDFLTFGGNPSHLRVTQIRWQSSNNRHRVDWSYATDGNNSTRLLDADMAGISHRLPPMINGERVLLVESFTSYTPAFDVGLSPTINFENFVPTSPRFAPMLAKN
jgi:hypothetical protein